MDFNIVTIPMLSAVKKDVFIKMKIFETSTEQKYKMEITEPKKLQHLKLNKKVHCVLNSIMEFHNEEISIEINKYEEQGEKNLKEIVQI